MSLLVDEEKRFSRNPQMTAECFSEIQRVQREIIYRRIRSL